jgi:hypothetical protein
MLHPVLDLNAEIMRSMSMNPAETAERTITNVLGEHYQFVTTPHLNPSPDDIVAMQQVSPAPQYDVRVRPIARRDVIPNRTWRDGSYIISHENGKFSLMQTSPRSFLGMALADKETMIHTTNGQNSVERMISYIDNSNFPSDVKTNFTNRLAAAAGIRLGKAISEARATGTFTSPIYNSNDFMPQVVPTGMTDDGFYGTGYDWGNTISELPDM